MFVARVPQAAIFFEQFLPLEQIHARENARERGINECRHREFCRCASVDYDTSILSGIRQRTGVPYEQPFIGRLSPIARQTGTCEHRLMVQDFNTFVVDVRDTCFFRSVDPKSVGVAIPRHDRSNPYPAASLTNLNKLVDVEPAAQCKRDHTPTAAGLITLTVNEFAASSTPYYSAPATPSPAAALLYLATTTPNTEPANTTIDDTRTNDHKLRLQYLPFCSPLGVMTCQTPLTS
jgi:hypothetical protein